MPVVSGAREDVRFSETASGVGADRAARACYTASPSIEMLRSYASLRGLKGRVPRWMRRFTMKRLLMISVFLFAGLLAVAQNQTTGPNGADFIVPGDNLAVEKIPPIPVSIVEKADQYGEFRAASLFDWHPTRREILIGTRFADVAQVHLVTMPGGARTQLTFFPDRIRGA